MPADLRNRIAEARGAQQFARAAKIGVEAVQWLAEHPIGATIARVTGDAGALPP